MPTHPTSPSHPKKPARKRTVGDFILAAIGYAIVIPMFAFCLIASPIGVYSEFVSIKDDIWLHWFGVLARNPDAYYIHHRTRYSEEEFCISYETVQGQEHHKCTDLLMPFTKPDTNQPLIVHYDPAAPDHASTSWGRQRVLSRTVPFLFCSFLTLVLELSVISTIVEKLTGWDMLATSSMPGESLVPAVATKPSNTPGPGLRNAALELSASLEIIVSGLQSQTGANAPYAGAIVAELNPLIAQYNRAVLDARSRDEADRALAEIVACINDFNADKKKRGMHLGFRHMLDMRKYESLTDIFRETKYRNDSL